MILNSKPGFFVNKHLFENLSQLDDAIEVSEKVSDTQLKIVQSDLVGRRVYNCRSHIGCTFNAKFGLRYRYNCIILKRFCFEHSGTRRPETASDGRNWKTHGKKVMKPCVGQVTLTKKAPPCPADVMKAAAIIHNSVMSYNQAYRAIQES
jgi:hypothetical protein